MPEVFMPLYILFPKDIEDKTKVYITPAGHLGGGAVSIIGDRSNPLVSAKIDTFNYDYGLQLAKKGCIVVAPETIGFGERRELASQKEEDILTCSCYHISHMAEPLGMTLAGIQVFDLICLIDYLETRDDIDTSNLSCLGFSGGGLQTLWLCAVDDRIKKAIISGYMYGYKDALLERNGNCNCNYIPHLWENYDMGDIGALLAPRKLFIQSGDKDHLNGKNGVANVKSQLEIIKKAYSFYDAQDLVTHHVFEGPHKWYSDKIDEYIQ
jgi:dienelactone hydrolase